MTVPSPNGHDIQNNASLPKFHTPNPGTCDCHLTGQKDSAGVIKLRLLTCRDYPGRPKYNQNVLLMRREGCEEEKILESHALTMEGETSSQGT